MTPRCRPCDEDVQDPQNDGCFVPGPMGVKPAKQASSYMSVKPNSKLTEAYYKVPL